LSLKPSHNGDVDEKIKHELDMRAKTQPLGTKNVGSVFKNPPNDFAARLIEAAGLKGHRQGRVRFSPKHANFIENTGGATAKEAMDLIQLAQKTIKEKFSIDLELEVNVVAQPPALSA
jgi:UDP-N-acetylmuramate dehydrogenase